MENTVVVDGFLTIKYTLNVGDTGIGKEKAV